MPEIDHRDQPGGAIGLALEAPVAHFSLKSTRRLSHSRPDAQPSRDPDNWMSRMTFIVPTINLKGSVAKTTKSVALGVMLACGIRQEALADRPRSEDERDDYAHR
jgi:hypothetical protein